VLPLLKAELKKSSRRMTGNFRIFLLILSIAAIAVSYVSFSHGFSSDSGIYTSASDRYLIQNRLFQHFTVESFQDGIELLKEGKIDVFITDTRVFVRDDMKSMSAGEEMKRFIETEFSKWLYNKYGEKAFPVLIRAEYLKREIKPEFTPKPISAEEIEKIQERAPSKEKIESEKREEVIKKAIEQKPSGGEVVGIKRKGAEFYTPDTFSPPSLISKMVQAFLFLIPSFFAMQLFSSSLAEDVRLKRIEIFLSTPLGNTNYLFQKMIPYFTLSVIFALIPSVIMASKGIVYVLPAFILLFSAQAFIAVNSRSYRELTFLILVANLLVLVYLVIPSVFSGLPLSDISPITFLLRDLANEKFSLADFLMSSAPLIFMGLTLIHLSSESMTVESIQSYSSPFKKFAEIMSSSAKSDSISFVLAAMTVFFSFFFEFFLIFFSLSVPLLPSFAVLMLGVALIEEFFKSLLIYPARTIRRALAVASGFFLAEKSLLFAKVFSDYSIVLPGQFLLFPFLLHLTASSIFAVLSRKDWRLGYIAAVAIHFAYNYMAVSGI